MNPNVLKAILKFCILKKLFKNVNNNTAQQREISTILKFIGCADFENDFAIAELALIFQIIWVH